MRIDIITSEIKKANRKLNISLLVFAFFMLLLFLSPWLPENDFGKIVFLISLFASLGLIVILIILSIFRQSKKETFELTKNQIVELIINSQIGIEKISKISEIEYTGNIIKLNSDLKVCEISNKSAFDLLKSEYDIKTVNQSKKKQGLLEMSPKKLFDDLMSMLWHWS